MDRTAERGIGFAHVNGRSRDQFFAEVFGSGAIFFDAEGDGDADLYLLNQTTIARPHPEPVPRSELYLNDGSGRFARAPAGTALEDHGYALGVCGADVENDGDIDLYVVRFDGPNALYRNDGDLSFTEVAAAAGVEGAPDLDTGCAFADVDGDGFVDLYVGGYADHGRRNNPVCRRRLKSNRKRVRVYCNPKDFEPIPDILYRNRGDGTFEDITSASGIDAGSCRSMGIAFSDADLDGDQDLFVACDRSASLLFENLGDGRFRDRSHAGGVALSADGIEEAGMGTAWGDYDDDGLPDLVKTNYEFEVNNLYRNNGGLRFTEMAGPSGTGRSSFVPLAWGTDFVDLDNDSDLDLFVANGHLRDLSLYLRGRKDGAGYEQANLLYEQIEDRRFVSRGTGAGPALAGKLVSRGFAWADIEGDGDIDFVVTNLHGPARLHVNETSGAGHWLRVRLTGTRSNRSAIGARVTAAIRPGADPAGGRGRTLTREVRSGQSYLSQSELVVHFGLGAAGSVERLTVHWPSGLVETLYKVPAGRTIEIVEGRADRTLDAPLDP